MQGSYFLYPVISQLISDPRYILMRIVSLRFSIFDFVKRGLGLAIIIIVFLFS